MVLPRGHMWVVMGGPEAQSGTLRGELEIGPKFGAPGPPEALPAAHISYQFSSRIPK